MDQEVPNKLLSKFGYLDQLIIFAKCFHYKRKAAMTSRKLISDHFVKITDAKQGYLQFGSA